MATSVEMDSRDVHGRLDVFVSEPFVLNPGLAWCHDRGSSPLRIASLCMAACEGSWTSMSRYRVRLRQRSQIPHAGDKSIALTRNGHQEIVLVWTLAERSPQRRNLPSQIVLIDRGFRPHAVQKLIFTDGVVPLLEQDHEHVEGLRRDGDETAFSPQLPLARIHNEGTKGISGV